MASKFPERRKVPNEILLKYFCDLCRLFTTESQVTELPGAAENLDHRKKKNIEEQLPRSSAPQITLQVFFKTRAFA